MRTSAAVILAVLAACTTADGVWADDSTSSFGLPPLQSDPPHTVVPHACDVSIVADHVNVDLTVTTRETQPALLVSGPLFGWSGGADPYPEKQFPELRVRINDAPIHLEDRFEAFAGGTNVTQLIKSAGMDPWAITHTPPVTRVHEARPPVLKALQNLRAIEKAGEDYLARWTARRIVRIPLQESENQRVMLAYAARPVTSVAMAAQAETRSREKRYCMEPKETKYWGRAGSGQFVVREYAISTSIDGASPTSVTVTLSDVGGDSKADAWYFCGPHARPNLKRGIAKRVPADVDDEGVLHLLWIGTSSGSAR